jgi:hypothetical protein
MQGKLAVSEQSLAFGKENTKDRTGKYKITSVAKAPSQSQ